MRKLCSVLALSSIVLVLAAASAQAADVTLGPDLTGTYLSESCGAPCTLANTSLTQAGAQLTSPVTGVVVRWNVIGGTTAGSYRLRTMNPGTPPSFLFTGSTATVSSVPTAGIQTFTATVPIVAGQAIALDMSPSASIGLAAGLGTFDQWEPVPEQGDAPPPIQVGGVDAIGFNAEVQPAPTIAALGTTSGPTAGGTSVTVTGTDFEGATAVKFGSIPAAFMVNSEGQITATSPAGSGSVPVSVTTVAGTATSGQQFGYQAPEPPAPAPTPAPISPPAKTCTVPKLKGKSLNVARTAIIRADCNVGRVNKKKGVKAKTAKVVGQSSKPGSVLPPRTAVNVTLGKG